MTRKFNSEEWLDLLLDGKLSTEEARQFETWLNTHPDAKALSIEKEREVRRLLNQLGKDTPAFQNSQFMWSQVKGSIQKNTRPESFIERIFGIPRWTIGIASVATILCLLVVTAHRHDEKKSDFGNISSLYSFHPHVSATSYPSTSGNATIVWLTGLDDYPSEFGQIWQLYSFKPDVTATSYDSASGNATIIWVSGMDDEKGPETESSL
jgi:hypothetical protein